MDNKSKIVLWSAVLFVLLILCSGYHSNRIALANGIISADKSVLTKQAEKQPSIMFDVIKQGNDIEVGGKFYDKEQMRSFGNNFDVGKDVVYISKNFNVERESDEAISLAKELAPIFNRDFVRGSIRYHGGKLVINGVVRDEKTKKLVETILKKYNVPYVNSVKVLKEDIDSDSDSNSAGKSYGGDATQDSNSSLKPTKYNYDEIYAQMTPKQREMSRDIEGKISSLLKEESITFKTASAKLTKKGVGVVEKIAIILKEYPTVYIEIAGHTDDVGNDRANLELSKRRVESVKSKLISLGIKGDRLEAVGYGESRPIVPNDSEENREKNRRVEFHIIKIEEVK